MMDIGYERIYPAPNYPVGIDLVVLSAYGWDSRASDVKSFKDKLKIDLRAVQLGRCCYCRRLLPDPMATHLEHIVERAVYPQFTFEVRNIGLSCSTCNSMKNSNFLRLCGGLSKRASIKGGVKVKVRRCPILVEEIKLPIKYPVESINYRWVHPHFDSYSNHVRIQKGWFFLGVSIKGRRMVRGLKLNAISLLERRALRERLASRQGVLPLLVGALYELNNEQARDVCRAVLSEIRRRRP